MYSRAFLGHNNESFRTFVHAKSYLISNLDVNPNSY